MSTQITNLNDLSDEELQNLDPSTLGTVTDSNVGTDPAEELNEATTPDPVDNTDEDQPQGKQEESVETEANTEQENTGDTPVEGEQQVDTKNESTTEQATKEDVKKEEKAEKAEAPAINADEVVAKLFAPFKANGKEMKVENIDEALDLMRMGANYNKKMSALKPNLKLMKMLENNGLLDEAKLEFLIDVSNKSPEAISRLIKESGLDPLDLGDEQAGKYKPSNHKVTDQEMALESVLDDINDSPVALRTLQVLTKEWDEQSRKFATGEPELIKILNGHMETGVYDLIQTELDRQRALGRLTNVPDLHAYKQLGDAMEAEGRFKHIFGGSSPSGQGTKPAPVVVQPKTPNAKKDEELKQQRKAAGGTPPAAPAKAQVNFNPLDMPEEEFLKLNPKFN